MHFEQSESALSIRSRLSRAPTLPSKTSTILLRRNAPTEQSASIQRNTSQHSFPTLLTPTLPTPLSMFLNQVSQLPLKSFPLNTKFQNPSFIDISCFSRVFPRRPRKILDEAQTTVVAIARLDGTKDIDRTELIGFDIDRSIGIFDSWEKTASACPKFFFGLASGSFEWHLVHADGSGAGIFI